MIAAGSTRDRYLGLLIDEMIPAFLEAGLAEFCDVYCDDATIRLKIPGVSWKPAALRPAAKDPCRRVRQYRRLRPAADLPVVSPITSTIRQCQRSNGWRAQASPVW
jgi:hypothetical protein